MQYRYSRDILIKNGFNNVIQHKVQLALKIFQGMMKKKPYLMYERLPRSSSSDEEIFDSLVLCKIFKKKKKGDACEEIAEEEVHRVDEQEEAWIDDDIGNY